MRVIQTVLHCSDMRFQILEELVILAAQEQSTVVIEQYIASLNLTDIKP